MTLIVYYVVFMIVGDFAAYLLGLFTEYEWGSQVSLIVFLSLFSFSVGVMDARCLDHEARTGGAAAFLKHLAPGGVDGVHRRN